MIYSFGDGYEVDDEGFTLRKTESPIPIPDPALCVLICFLKKPRAVIESEALKKQAWGERDVHDTTLQHAISDIRKFINKKSIRTVRGHGYIFTLKVTYSTAEPSKTVDVIPGKDKDQPNRNMSGEWKIYYFTYNEKKGGVILGKSDVHLFQDSQRVTGSETLDPEMHDLPLRYRVEGRNNDDRFHYFGRGEDDEFDVCWVMFRIFYDVDMLIGMTGGWDYDKKPFASPALLVKKPTAIENEKAIDLLIKEIEVGEKIRFFPDQTMGAIGGLPRRGRVQSWARKKQG